MSEAVSRFFFPSAIGLFAVLVFVLGVTVWRRRARTAYLQYWSVFCLSAGLWATAVVATSFVGSSAVVLVSVRISFLFAVLSFLSLFWFVASFSGELRARRVISFMALAWAAVLVALFLGTDLLIAGVTPSEFTTFTPVSGPLMPLYGAFLVFIWLLFLVSLVRVFRRSTGLRRTQAGYMLLAFGIACISSVGTMLPTWIGSSTILAALPGLLMPLFPLLITYAMIRHRLWDVRTVMHKTAVWAILLMLLAMPLYGALWLQSTAFPTASATDQAAILLLLFMLAYGYVRFLKPKIDHLFQRRALDQQRLLERFSGEMSTLSGAEEVSSKLLDILEEGLYPETACVRIGRTTEEWQTISRPEKRCSGAPDPSDPFIIRAVDLGSAVDRSHLEVDEHFAAVLEAAEQYFEETGSQVCLPLVAAGRLVGLVELGGKRNLKAYGREDLEFLERLGGAAATGLSNALLFERVVEQRQDLEEAKGHLEERVLERTKELAQANQQLRQLDELKNRFFANISHELRTPLTTILAPVESILDGELGEFDAEQCEHFEGIRHSALELLKLIDDLLDLSRLEESRLKLRLAPVDLRGLIERIREFTEPLARRKQIALEVVAGESTEAEVDERKLERVIVNLLSNALKFTDPGGRVAIRLDAGDGRAVIEVKDSGIGIPEQELPHIFDRFRQVDASITRRQGGSGIGLALAQELIELHGGRLVATSHLGRGSTFRAEIPRSADGLPEERIERRLKHEPVEELRREEDQGLPEWSDAILARPEYRFMGLNAATERRAVPRAWNGDPKAARVLVADDNPEVLKLLNQVLGESYELWSVQDGAKAWELFRQNRHDLVLADVMMPEMSGLELCHRIKAEPQLQDTPVVLLTARADTEHRVEGHGVGADAYLTKPFSPAELRAVIGGLLVGRARRTEVAARRRTASLETLLAGMAHELRNAAHQVKNAHSAMSVLTRRALENGETADAGDPRVELEPRIDQMEAVAQRALARIAKVVHSLAQYSRGRMQVPWSDHDIDRLVAREVELIPGIGERDVSLDLELDSGARVRGPAEELRQMVLNLVENAVQAVDAGGRVRVATAASSGRVTLSVEDDGCGIPAEHRERVFDLFFTTKDPGRGMGLGLALCQRTVADLGGSIEIRSEEGEGTEVIVELPMAGAGAVREGAPGSA